MADDLITTVEAARILGITKQGVHCRVLAGYLTPVLVIGRRAMFTRSAIASISPHSATRPKPAKRGVAKKKSGKSSRPKSSQGKKLGKKRQ